MILIENAKVYTMAGNIIENGSILIHGNKIIGVDEHLEAEGAAKVDAQGMTVLPGLIDAHCHIGMWEDGIGDEGADGNEDTEPVTPELRAIDAVNPFDTAFAEAYKSGITAVMTGPGSANVIGGQFIAMKTWGRRIEEMALAEPAALKIAFGENPKRVYNEQKKSPVTRMSSAALLRETIVRAMEYMRKREQDEDPPERNLGMEAVTAVIKGEMPLKIHCHRADDILSAIRISKEFGLKYTLDHCTEGHLLADILKEENAQIILGPLFSTRPKIEMRNLDISAPYKLYKAGIDFAISSDHPETPIQYLLIYAALAVREGLPEIEALK
ncbi:MAG TPA: amidohydrolase, partial [Clostridia bacterium]|nr:amidohydrolase [Clostridia bacterium]